MHFLKQAAGSPSCQESLDSVTHIATLCMSPFSFLELGAEKGSPKKGQVNVTLMDQENRISKEHAQGRETPQFYS